jgi:hypothetical protein
MIMQDLAAKEGCSYLGMHGDRGRMLCKQPDFETSIK